MKLSPVQARALASLADNGDLFCGGVELPRRTVAVLERRGLVRVHPGGATSKCPRSGVDVFTPGPALVSITPDGWAALGRAPTWPRWIEREQGDFELRYLREVSHELFVASYTGHLWLRRPFATVQLYDGCLAVNGPSLRRPIFDAHAIAPELLDEILAFVREHRPRRSVVIQCQAGLSRSASVAAAVAYVLDGVAWGEAERRVLVEEHPTFPRELTLASAKGWALRTRTMGVSRG